MSIVEDLRESAALIEADLNSAVLYKVKELRNYLLSYNWNDFHKALMKAYSAIIYEMDIPLNLRSYVSVMLKEQDAIGLDVVKDKWDIEWSKKVKNDLPSILQNYDLSEWEEEFIRRSCKTIRRILLSKKLYDKVHDFLSNPSNLPFESEPVKYAPPKKVSEEWVQALFDALNDRKELDRRFSELVLTAKESGYYYG